MEAGYKKIEKKNVLVYDPKPPKDRIPTRDELRAEAKAKEKACQGRIQHYAKIGDHLLAHVAEVLERVFKGINKSRTEKDLANLSAAQAKRDRRALRNLENAAKAAYEFAGGKNSET